MRSLVFILLTLLCLPAFAQSSSTLPPLVSSEWLRDHIKDQDLVVLHVGFGRKDYLREHIPGARFMWFNWLSPSTPDESTIMNSIEAADSILEQAGVSNSSRIVVYFTGSGVSTTTRTMIALLYYGFHDRVALLDGGIDGWKKMGGAVTQDVPTVQRGTLTLTTAPSMLADAEFIRQHLTDPGVTVIDARAKNFYDGSSMGSGRSGHVRGSISLPFSTLVDSLNRFKPNTELTTMFEKAGYKKGSTVVAYCHVGQQATVVLEACRLLNIPYKLYDGSFEDWGSLDDKYPVDVVQEEKK